MSIQRPYAAAAPDYAPLRQRTELPPQAIAVCFLFCLLPAIAAGGAMGLPVLLSLAGLAALNPQILKNIATTRPDGGLLLLAALLFWASASALWSPWDSQAPIKILLLVLTGLFWATAASKSGPRARFALAATCAALFVLAVLLAFEAFSQNALNSATSPGAANDAPSTDAAKGLVILVALAWPAIGFLACGPRTHRLLAILLLILIGGLSFQFGQASAWVGFYAGCAACAAAWIAPRSVLSLGFGGLVLWLLTAPFLTPILVASPHLVESVPMSWAARVAIWRYTCAQILEQPWIGHGLEAGRAVTDRVQIRDWNIRGVENHPHSASLQIWYETGAVGALLAAALLAYTGWLTVRAFATDRTGAAAVAAMLATIGLMANVGWSLWQEWWTATLIIAVTLACALRLRAARG